MSERDPTSVKRPVTELGDSLEEDRTIRDERSSVFDAIEKRGDKIGNRRPIRDTFENTSDYIPEGPGGILGDGDVVGIVGLILIRAGQLAVLPIPGVRQPGFKVISHGVEDKGEFERHVVRINAASENVARTVAEYVQSAPSNIDYVTSEIDTVRVEEITERSTYSTWEMVVDVADRGAKEV